MKICIINILVWRQRVISGGHGCSNRLGMCQASSSAHCLHSIVQLTSRRGCTNLPAFKELPDWPAAAQMEGPRWVCMQDGSHNATILLGREACSPGGRVWRVGRGELAWSQLSRCWRDKKIYEQHCKRNKLEPNGGSFFYIYINI